MTQAMLCDGCGRISTTRPAEGEPTTGWWMLSMDPAPDGGSGWMGMATIAIDESDDPYELPTVTTIEQTWEPPRHFCSAPCLAEWATRFVRDATPEGA